ncbi:hypothetical protein H072_6081 [Dactylellina haptotyla CBS 200.50]|uniref:protein-ribulosamine 3-kinase n=1 Tax=Dactylellina haptotyla (strain CBS 200.50) TaxID=1284197 RepID=S8BXR5_DACHA|nr:hypothetical protein H072_6081 [Dactylellina haptotyla CBS 200.50]
MTQQINEALATALNLDASVTTVSPHGGSGFASTLKVQSGNQSFFVKTGSGYRSKAMFEVPVLCPRAFAHGELGDEGYFLATEFIELSRSSSGHRGGISEEDSLAAKLAKLHSEPAPSAGKYGFPVSTCCGSTIQDNTYEDNWPDFFVKRRLNAIFQACNLSHGPQSDLVASINRTATIARYLLSRLSPSASKPVVIHGDLWSGNQSRGSIPPRITHATPLIFDPSGCYAPAEYDHGIMIMFGGFDRIFWKDYESIVPRGEPIDEYEDRVKLYTLYHTLNHYALFGGGYKESAIGIMRELERDYGDKADST